MTDIINLGRNAAEMKEAPAEPAYTGVRIYVGTDEDGADLYFAAGNEEGSVLEIENPWGTQAMATSILNTIKGYSYKPLSATGTLLEPAAEMGDAVVINKAYTVLAQRDTTFGSLLVSDIAAPSDGELGHEYPYVIKEDRKIQRQISKASSYLSVEINQIKAQVTDDHGNYTVLTLKSDGLYVDGTPVTIDGDYITDGSIGSLQMENGSINTDKLANLCITSTKIASNAITTPKIAAEAITAAKIASHTITASEIASNTITADQIKARTITAAEIATGTITAKQIASETITTDELLLTGMLEVYNSASQTASAFLGYGTGYDGRSTTYGAKLEASNGSNYIIVTNAGARMTAGGNYIYTTSSGCFCSSEMTVTSDARVKEDIDDDMTKYKAVLMRLRPVSFKYKPEWIPSTQRHTGVIAQETERLMAEYGVEDWSLSKIGGEDMHYISYEALVPVLVSCVQELSQRVEALEAAHG